MEFTVINVIVFAIISYLLFANFELGRRVNKLESRVRGIQDNWTRATKEMNLPENPVNAEVRVLLKEGNLIQAVKLVRETLGLSLLEAKQYVDALNDEGRR